MKTYNIILDELKKMGSNEERREFLNAIVLNENIPRNDLRRIAYQIFIESNFVERYFTPGFKETLRFRLLYFIQTFKNLLRNI